MLGRGLLRNPASQANLLSIKITILLHSGIAEQSPPKHYEKRMYLNFDTSFDFIF